MLNNDTAIIPDNRAGRKSILEKGLTVNNQLKIYSINKFTIRHKKMENLFRFSISHFIQLKTVGSMIVLPDFRTKPYHVLTKQPHLT